jgi:hypothetical protein
VRRWRKSLAHRFDEERLEQWLEANENQTAGGFTLRSKRDPITGKKLWWIEQEV